jgi:hypothetical protein
VTDDYLRSPSLHILVAALGLLFAAGCAFPVPLPFLGDPLDDIQLAIEPGHSDRKAMHSILGNPVLASRYWRFDLFRQSARDVNAMILFVPWPLPFGWSTDHTFRYTLVTYDANGIVEAVETGIHFESGWFGPESGTMLSLEAGGVLFQPRHESLLVNPARRDAYMEVARTASHCTVIAGCGLNTPCFDAVQLDKGRRLHLPFGALIAVGTSPGEHVLNIWDNEFPRSRDSVAFDCREGDVLYFAFGIDFHRKNGLFWKIDRPRDMPQSFAAAPLVINQNSQWLIVAEENPAPDDTRPTQVGQVRHEE